jgi:ABC-type bacteriocin/lantibiotic exporter with double-glycine peptidase domain
MGRASSIRPLSQVGSRSGDASASADGPVQDEARLPIVTAARCIVYFAEQFGLRVDREAVIETLEQEGTPTISSVVTFARSLNIELVISALKIADLVKLSEPALAELSDGRFVVVLYAGNNVSV